MKTTASLVVIAGVVSLTTADALPPQDVPVRCAAICGPIADLSSKCTPVKPKEGSPVGGSTNGTGASAFWSGRRRAVAEQQDEQDEDFERRFYTIVPAPTSFAAKYSSVLNPDNDPLAQPPRGTPTQVFPVIVKPSNPSPPPPPPPPAAPAIPSSRPEPPPPPPPPKEQAPSTSRTQSSTPTSPDQRPETPSLGTATKQTPEKVASTMTPVGNTGTTMDAEEQCVCLNKSFDVQRVAALCTSCIDQAGDLDTNMHAVMSVCNFAERAYTPGDDSIVANIRVSATRPTAVWGHQAGVSNAGHRVTRRRMGEASGVVLCVLMFVLSAM